MPALWPVAELADLVLPRSCLGCRRPGAPLCPACVPRGPALPVAHPDCPVFAAAAYGGAVRTALLAYKERGRRDLRRPLAELLARAVAAAAVGACRPVVVVPVPSAAGAARRRGGDHVARLARAARGVRIGPGRLGSTAFPLFPMFAVLPALHHVRAVRDSAGLGAAERRANLAHALRALPAPGGFEAIVVDDIVTSGATLAEAARALRSAGWLVRGAAVVASAPRHANHLARRPGSV